MTIELYILLDAAFVIMALFRLYLPANTIARDKLALEGIQIDDYVNIFHFIITTITFILLSALLFPIMFLDLLLSHNQAVAGYANSTVDSIRKMHKENKT